MFEVNLICHCAHTPCGAERLVRVAVQLSRGSVRVGYVSAFDVDMSDLARTLEAAGWKLVSPELRVLCPSHKEPAR